MKNIKDYLERRFKNRRATVFTLGLFAVFYVLSAVAVVSVDTVPLTVSNTVPSNLVLVPSVEWPTVVTLANDPGQGDNTSGYTGYSTASTTTCPTGFTLSGSSCTQTTAATPNCASPYTFNSTTSSCQQTTAPNTSCPTSYSPSGTTCQQSVTANAKTCPSGYTASGTACQQSVTANAATCPSGYTASGTACQQSVTANAKTCPSGYTASGTTCQKSVAATPSYSCPPSYTLSGSTCTLTKQSTCPSSPATGYSGYKTSSGSGSNKTCSGPANIVSYSCSSGTLSGSNCISTATPTAYSCSSGTLSGSNCIITATPLTYSCSSGTLSGSNCISTTTPLTYSCSSGTLSGSSCILSTALVYSCPSGYTSGGSGSGTTCTQTGSAPTYSCASGTVSGTNCILTTNATTQVTPYVGYFNSSLCYAYSYDAVEANRYFYPVSATTTDNSGNAFSCAGQTGGTPARGLWSGNFLNWATMQAIDTFRLTLTGGYRVNRPADGTPTAVTITGADGNPVSKAISDQPSVTYLQKATTDRWTSGYTDTRSLSANAANSTPSSAPVSSSSTFITRVPGLRSQMWFMPSSSSKTSLGSAGGCCSATNAIRLPVPSASPATAPTTWGDQTEASGTGIPGTPNTMTAIPYNPTYHALPNATTTTSFNTTACGTFEEGCTSGYYSCPNGSGTTVNTQAYITSATCAAQSTAACPSSGNPYFKKSTGLCQVSSTKTTSVSNSCPSSWALPGSDGNGGLCTLAAYAGTSGYAQHTTYGSNQVYAVSIRVQVCDGTWDTRDMCTQYGSYYKPEGLLQKNATKTRYSLFSYLTESDSNGSRVGGVMRARQKLIGPVITGEQPYPERTGRYAGIDNPEWDPATGAFINDPDSNDSAATTSSIGSCTTAATPDASGCAVKYSGVINYINRFGELGTGLGSTSTTYTDDPLSTLKAYDNLSELYYSAISYLRGLGNNVTASNLASTHSHTNGPTFYYQNADGFPVITDWYQNGANQPVTKWNASTPALTTGKPADPMLYSCQTTAVLGIGDTNTNSESYAYSSDTSSTMGGSSGPFSSSALTTWAGYLDSGASAALGTKVGIAALAYWGHLNDLRADIPNTVLPSGTTYRGQNISTYWVDVVELGNYKTNTTNQYYNATKFGGLTIPASAWNSNGNAVNWDISTNVVPSLNWLASNMTVWTNKTTTSPGGYYQPSNMYFANGGANMVAGLNAAFTKILSDATGSGASLAANSTQLNSGTTSYQARYVSSSWTGDLVAFPVLSNGSISTTSVWSGANSLPPTVAMASSRVIKTTTDGTASGMVDFKTTAIAAGSPLRSALGTSSDSVINYLRGDPSTTTYRSRTTALGDIVDSQPIYLGVSDPNIFYGKSFTGIQSYSSFASSTLSRKQRVYVAANDGMLHSFNAECTLNSTTNPTACLAATPSAGAEIFAYMPKAVLTNTTTPILNLTDPQYGTSSTVPHQYFNDGELTIADVYSTASVFTVTTSNWHSVLVGTTGRGTSKAVYALDVTDATNPTLLWERSAGDGKAGSNYIGQMVGKPIIAQTSDGVWSVLIGNGYNSQKSFAALLQFAIADGTLTVHTTDETSTTGANNGLASPAVWMANAANGVSTEAYAGDLTGRVWHFNLSDPSGTAGTVVFTAMDSSSTPQPITSGMLMGRDPATANVWLFFGTGRFLTQTDLRDTSVQTWYGIIAEGTNATSSATTRSSLVQRSVLAQQDATSTTIAERATTTATLGDMTGKSGWYLDLLYNTAQGERMVTPNQFQGSLLVGTSRIPTSADPCNPSGSGFEMVVYPFTGGSPTSSFFDTNSNGTVGSDDTFTVGGVTYVASGIGFTHAPNNPIFVGNYMLLSFDDASTKSYDTAGTIGVLKRLTWREVLAQ